jgi:hypothetical protein
MTVQKIVAIVGKLSKILIIFSFEQIFNIDFPADTEVLPIKNNFINNKIS